jgi:hypothetical protein
MKTFFGIVFIIVGLINLPAAITPCFPETIGGLLGLGLSCGLPAYFLLRNKNNKQNTNEPQMK